MTIDQIVQRLLEEYPQSFIPVEGYKRAIGWSEGDPFDEVEYSDVKKRLLQTGLAIETPLEDGLDVMLLEPTDLARRITREGGWLNYLKHEKQSKELTEAALQSSINVAESHKKIIELTREANRVNKIWSGINVSVTIINVILLFIQIMNRN